MAIKWIPITAVLIFLAVIVLLAILFRKEQGKRGTVHQTVVELTMIADAAEKYRSAKEGWPVYVDDLVPEYLRAAVLSNPLGNRYILSEDKGSLVVQTLLPAGMAKPADLGAGVELMVAGTMDVIKVERKSLPKKTR